MLSIPRQALTTAWPAKSLWKRTRWSLIACRPGYIPKLADSWPDFAPQEPKKCTVACCERSAEQDQIRESPSCNTACYRIQALSIDFDGVFLQTLDDNQYWLCPPVYHFIGAVGQKAQHLAGKAFFNVHSWAINTESLRETRLVLTPDRVTCLSPRHIYTAHHFAVEVDLRSSSISGRRSSYSVNWATFASSWAFSARSTPPGSPFISIRSSISRIRRRYIPRK